MYVVVHHTIKNPQTAFARGEKLLKNEGAPAGSRGLTFLPAADGSAVSCLWEAESVESIRQYVDTTLGDAADNLCYEIDASKAFADPTGLPERAAALGS